MPEVTEQMVLSALSQITDPDLQKDIVSLGFIKDLRICGGAVAFTIELTTPACPIKERFRSEAERLVQQIPGVEQVNVEMSAQTTTSRQPSPDELLPDVKHVIAVASGKGGVGKSTVSVNLAVALAQMGAAVGLLDADIYGPSIPMMMGEFEPMRISSNKILPTPVHGVDIVSLGLLMDPDQAVAWRGPMVAGAIKQLLTDVYWGARDYLIVDLPPGTGDAPMTLAQTAPLTGVVIVTTPQDVALRIAGKSVSLFRAMQESLQRSVPILGIVENMSGFACPHCGEVSQVFTGSGGEQAAERLRTPFLGRIPLDPMVCQSGDQGTPAIVAHPESATAAAFRTIAGELARQASRTAALTLERA